MQTVSISILKHLLRIDASSIKYYAEESFDIEENSSNKEKLRHSFFFGIVGMKKRFRSGISFKCFIECIEYKSIVITVAAYIRDWTFIAKIQDCTEIYFSFSIIVSSAIFEFAHIR